MTVSDFKQGQRMLINTIFSSKLIEIYIIEVARKAVKVRFFDGNKERWYSNDELKEWFLHEVLEVQDES